MKRIRVLVIRQRKKLLAFFLLAFLIALLPATFHAFPPKKEAVQKQITNIPPSSIKSLSWLAFDGGNERSGVNDSETTILPGYVSQLKKTWQTKLPYRTNGSLVFISSITTLQGIKDLLFATTQTGNLVAIDAANGNIVWQKQTQGQFVDNQGTSSSPAIDPSRQYVYSYGLDGKIHKYAIGEGQEITGNGFPVTITILTNVEKESSALNIGNGYLYVTISGYDGDFGHYVGHVVAINLITGGATIFNSLCSNIHQLLTDTANSANYCPSHGSGIWGRGGAVIDPVTKNVFVTTGNGNFNAKNNYGDSAVALAPDLSRIIDTYTPQNFTYLADNDLDLGSTAPVMIPAQPGSKTPYMALLGGKDSTLRLINRQNMSGQGGPNHVGGELQSIDIACKIFSHAAVWIDTTNTTWIFVTDMCSNLYAFKVVTTAGQSNLQLAYKHNNYGTSSPFIANNILYIQGNNDVFAIDPTTGNTLWNSQQSSAGGSIGSQHWQSPIVINGHLYIPDDDGNITAYGLPKIVLGPTQH